MTIKLHPSMAFGDGQHPTTQGMMRLMHELREEHQAEYSNILDMGCGSGILSILATQLWPSAQIMAADIEQEAAEMTHKNAALNDAAKQITALRSDGCNHRDISAHAPYDLVIANMLADPLISMAEGLTTQCAQGGIMLLSGILDWQAAQIRDAYETIGMKAIQALQVEEWCSVMFAKTA